MAGPNVSDEIVLRPSCTPLGRDEAGFLPQLNRKWTEKDSIDDDTKHNHSNRRTGLPHPHGSITPQNGSRSVSSNHQTKLPSIDRHKSNSVVNLSNTDSHENTIPRAVLCRSPSCPHLTNDAENDEPVGRNSQSKHYGGDWNGMVSPAPPRRRRGVSKERREKRNQSMEKRDKMNASQDMITEVKLPDILLNNKTTSICSSMSHHSTNISNMSYMSHQSTNEDEDAFRVFLNSRNSFKDALHTPVMQKSDASITSQTPTKTPAALLLPMRERTTRKHKKQNKTRRRHSENDMPVEHEKTDTHLQQQVRSLSYPEESGLSGWKSSKNLPDNEQDHDVDTFEEERVISMIAEENTMIKTRESLELEAKQVNEEMEYDALGKTDVRCRQWLAGVEENWPKPNDMT